MLFCSAVLTMLTRKFHRLFSIFSYCDLWQNDCKLPHRGLLYVLEEVRGLEPGAPLPPPSPVTLVIAELLLSHILSLLFSSRCYICSMPALKRYHRGASPLLMGLTMASGRFLSGLSAIGSVRH